MFYEQIYSIYVVHLFIDKKVLSIDLSIYRICICVLIFIIMLSGRR